MRDRGYIKKDGSCSSGQKDLRSVVESETSELATGSHREPAESSPHCQIIPGRSVLITSSLIGLSLDS
jgi:hypothetical protein